jgi:small subunit ribosomal protein S4
LEIITDNLASRASNYAWLEWDGSNLSGKFLNYPERADIPETINEQLIVDLYSK